MPDVVEPPSMQMVQHFVTVSGVIKFAAYVAALSSWYVRRVVGFVPGAGLGFRGGPPVGLIAIDIMYHATLNGSGSEMFRSSL